MKSTDTFCNIVIPKICGGYNNIGRAKPQTVSIYDGGNEYSRAVGEECEFHMRDILISLKYIDLDNLDDYQQRDGIFESISEIFRLESYKEEDILKEIQHLLSLSDDKLSSEYSTRFKLYSVFADAVKPLFIGIKNYFETQVKILSDYLNIDLNAYVNKWKRINKEENINSDSVILYQLGKDKNFITDIKEKAHNLETDSLIDYITDKTKWSYLDFCPCEPSLRMKHLLDFPLNIFFNMLPDPKYIEEQIEKINSLGIQNIEVPVSPQNHKKKGGVNNISLTIELIEKLICRLDNIKPLLQAWEKYYIEYAKIYSELAKKYHIIFN